MWFRFGKEIVCLKGKIGGESRIMEQFSVTIEPSIYYQQSFKNHSDYSTIGFKIGFGVYL